MFSCICPACLMEEVITPKITSKKERNMRSGHPLTPSVSYSFLQSWEHDSLFTFDKYTINISSNDSSSSDNESENRFIERNKINEIDQKP
ncbi:unnamed protein product [Rhizophagus irregularis]|nr:unnamed protein product [Rhizophagus irregularis]CAB5363963.1 unnamed protein product [Rhizophagus irregularis]